MRYSFPRWVLEILAITPDRVIAVRPKGGKGAAFGQAIGGLIGAGIAIASDKKERKKERPALEQLLETGKKSFSSSNSEIRKVEFKKGRAGLNFNILGKQKFKCYFKGFDLFQRPSALTTGLVVDKSEVEDFKAKLEDFKNLLQQVFGVRLSIKL